MQTRAWLRLLRPHQWLKNSFVLAGLLFSQRWLEGALFLQVLLATLAFCCMSSAVYIYNDWQDRAADRLHPRKNQRPLASGTIAVSHALVAMVILLLAAIILAGGSDKRVMVLIAGYGLLNVAYNHWLKRLFLLDVFALAGGFMLRLLAGTWGVGIPPSQWLLFCGGMLTLFLGFCKRRAECGSEATTVIPMRQVLRIYSPALLDKLIMITASCCILSYGLYAINAGYSPAQGHGTLLYTVPLVIYGIFRYLYLLSRTPDCGEDTARTVWHDRPLLLAVVLWLALTLYLLA